MKQTGLKPHDVYKKKHIVLNVNAHVCDFFWGDWDGGLGMKSTTLQGNTVRKWFPSFLCNFTC